MTLGGHGAGPQDLHHVATRNERNDSMREFSAPQHGACHYRQRGVTLLELMIVTVIVAILGLVALPSYRQYTIRAQRTEAKAALLQLAANQERFYLTNNTYTNNLAAVGFPGGVSEHGVYTLAIPVANQQTFQATATPTPGGGFNGKDMTSDAECAQFTLTQQGLKTALPDPNTVCW
jgi:type IV pilus assembly protein PilE